MESSRSYGLLCEEGQLKVNNYEATEKTRKVCKNSRKIPTFETVTEKKYTDKQEGKNLNKAVEMEAQKNKEKQEYLIAQQELKGEIENLEQEETEERIK